MIMRRSSTGTALVAAVLLLVAPFFLFSFWLQLGLFAMAAAIAAIGLTLLVGRAGQLSLGHAFFVAVGAYAYSFMAGSSSPEGASGLGWPPLAALVTAVVTAGLAGAVFSPISARLRGIYLGLASLGLVFIGVHVMNDATVVTGGYNGRNVAPFSLFGFSFSDTDPSSLLIFDVPFGELERLWYLGLVLLAIAWWFARNLSDSRPGRALLLVRDSENAAAAMGIDVRRYKAVAFTVSSMFAGLAGVLLALTAGQIVPNSFGLDASIGYLVMIVIGGMGSVGGAALGALFVTALPLVLNQYSSAFPFLSSPGSGGISAADVSNFIYGLAVILVLLFARKGLMGLGSILKPTTDAPRSRDPQPPPSDHDEHNNPSPEPFGTSSPMEDRST